MLGPLILQGRGTPLGGSRARDGSQNRIADGGGGDFERLRQMRTSAVTGTLGLADRQTPAAPECIDLTASPADVRQQKQTRAEAQVDGQNLCAHPALETAWDRQTPCAHLPADTAGTDRIREVTG
jgi:hypothetical protein